MRCGAWPPSLAPAAVIGVEPEPLTWSFEYASWIGAWPVRRTSCDAVPLDGEHRPQQSRRRARRDARHDHVADRYAVERRRRGVEASASRRRDRARANRGRWTRAPSSTGTAAPRARRRRRRTSGTRCRSGRCPCTSSSSRRYTRLRLSSGRERIPTDRTWWCRGRGRPLSGTPSGSPSCRADRRSRGRPASSTSHTPWLTPRSRRGMRSRPHRGHRKERRPDTWRPGRR